MEKADAIALQFGQTFTVPDENGGGSIDWSKVDVHDLESVRGNLPPCQARADIEVAHLVANALDQMRQRQDMLIHALVGVSGDDVIESLAAISNAQHLAVSDALSPSIMRYLNDIARANRGIGVRMDFDQEVSKAVSESVQAGGPVDYRQAAKAASGIAPAREKARSEDVAYINEEGV